MVRDDITSDQSHHYLRTRRALRALVQGAPVADEVAAVAAEGLSVRVRASAFSMR